jgi:hypothetical protein
MTINFALQYIPKRMDELGYGNSYTMRLRELVIQPEQSVTVEAYAQYFILVEPPDDIIVDSDTGIYDPAEKLSNERQYEHQGVITINNKAESRQYVRFIQLIPKK